MMITTEQDQKSRALCSAFSLSTYSAVGVAIKISHCLSVISYLFGSKYNHLRLD